MTAESTTIDETAETGLTEKAPAESAPTENTDVVTTQTAAKPNTAMIEAIGLSKFYGEFAASRNVDFKIHRGEVVDFLGPNGAGISTTMKLLTGYLAP